MAGVDHMGIETVHLAIEPPPPGVAVAANLVVAQRIESRGQARPTGEAGGREIEIGRRVTRSADHLADGKRIVGGRPIGGHQAPDFVAGLDQGPPQGAHPPAKWPGVERKMPSEEDSHVPRSVGANQTGSKWGQCNVRWVNRAGALGGNALPPLLNGQSLLR